MEFVVTSLKEEYEKDLQKAIINALRNDNKLYIRVEKENKNMFYSEIYADYRDEFSESQIAEILEHNCPMEAFYDVIWNGYDEIQIDMENEVVKMCVEDAEVLRLCELLKVNDVEDYIRDYVREVWYVTYPEDHFLKQEVKVNIMLDTGNGNYDFTHDNVLNYDGQYSGGEFEETSSILWLAKQQEKEMETRKFVKEYFNSPKWVDIELSYEERLKQLVDRVNKIKASDNPMAIIMKGTREWYMMKIELVAGIIREESTPDSEKDALLTEWEDDLSLSKTKTDRATFDCEDKFIASVIQELENLSSHMGTLTFLVTMTLAELIELKEAITEEPCENKYDPRENSGNGYITISKDTMCGLFDKWNGGGSVLEIELDKDVVLPIKYIFQARPECNGGSWKLED